jgi:hypothetical protein
MALGPIADDRGQTARALRFADFLIAGGPALHQLARREHCGTKIGEGTHRPGS